MSSDFTIININPLQENKIISKIKFDSQMPIYHEDSFNDIKNKIWIKTGIDPLRQCLFTSDNIYDTELIVNDIIFPVDIRSIFKIKHTDISIFINEFAINKYLIDSKENIKPNEFQSFSIIGNKKTLFLVDLETIMNNEIKNILLSDSYKFDIFYYGFIIMFWSNITYTNFKKYLKNKDSLIEEYELIENIKSQIKKENKILNKITNFKITTKKQISIISQKINFDLGIKFIDIRNVLDWISVSHKIPAIVGNIMNDDLVTSSYVIKKHISVSTESVESDTINNIINKIRNIRNYRKNIRFVSFIIKYEYSYLIFTLKEIGKFCDLFIEYKEDEKIDFEKNIIVLCKLTKSIIDIINNELSYTALPYGGKLQYISSDNILSERLHISSYYKKLVSLRTFILMKENLKDYESAGILIVRDDECSHNEYHQDNCFLIIFKKGMRTSEGREVKILLRTTDIKIEVLDSNGMDEFLIIQKYLFYYFEQFILTHKELSNAPTDINKYSLKTLYEKDPVLFDLKRYNKKLEVYSRLCQSERQPTLYTEEEYKNLSESKKKQLTEWYNFTTQGKSYYDCPNKKYPFLSFKTNKHPKGYCLPCCKKSKVESGESISNEIDQLCLKNKIVDSTQFGSQKYILNFDKYIPIGRYSKISDQLLQYINNYNTKCTSCNYTLYGVEQNNPTLNSVGLIMSILTNFIDYNRFKSIDEVIMYMTKKILEMGNNYHLIGNGLAKNFDSPMDLIDSIINIFINKTNDFSQLTEEWDDIFISLSSIIFNTDVIILEDIDKKMNLQASSDITFDQNKKILIVKNKIGYYPLFVSCDSIKYISMYNAQINETKSYCNIIDPINKFIEYYIAKVIGNQGMSQLCIIEKLINQYKDWNVTKKLVDSRNLCYAVILENDGNLVYFPVYYTLYNKFLSDIPIMYGSKYCGELKSCIYNFNTLMKFIDIFNKVSIDSKCNLYKTIEPQIILYNSNNQQIGFKSNNLYYFHEPIDLTIYSDKLLKKIIQYDIPYIDRNINEYTTNLLDGITDINLDNLYRLEYKQKLYKLFVNEFSNSLKHNKNKEIRNQLIKNINKSDLNSVKEINKLFECIDIILEEYYDDRNEIKKVITENRNNKKIKHYIENNLFNFDNYILKELHNIDNIELVKSEIKKIIDPLVKLLPESNITKDNIISNIHLPCKNIKDSSNSNYCDNNKLIVIDTLYEPFIDILATQIHNNADLKITSIFNNLEFKSHPNEIIQIF